jgi:hypothetical protein
MVELSRLAENLVVSCAVLLEQGTYYLNSSYGNVGVVRWFKSNKCSLTFVNGGYVNVCSQQILFREAELESDI